MTETSLFQEVAEDLERQRLEELWKRYGKFVVAGAVAALLGAAIFSGWQSWRTEHHQRTTGALIEILRQEDTTSGKEIAALEDFAAHNPHENQAMIALLRAAAIAAQQDNTEKARDLYGRIEAFPDSGDSRPFIQFATLMDVRSQMETGDAAKLQDRMTPLTQADAPWRFTARETQGYLALRAGDKAKAQKIFTDLSQDANAPQSLSERAADLARYLGSTP